MAKATDRCVLRGLLWLLPILTGIAWADPIAPFGFAPPEVALADFNTRSLRAADFNGDGLTDLILLNNERGRIDIYLQIKPGEASPTPVSLLRTDRWQPVLADARFHRQSLIPGGNFYDLVVGDFNQDGAQDFAVTDDQNRLLVYHGPAIPGWQPVARLPVTASQNAANTLAWDDQEKAILLLGERDIQEVRRVGEVYQARTVATVPREARPYNLFVLDMDGDGRRDVVYSIRVPRFSLAFHPRGKEGLEGVRLPLVEPPSDNLVPFGNAPLRMLGLHPRSGALQQITASNVDTPVTASTETPDVRFINLPLTRSPQSLWADLNGDGRTDLLVFSPGQPELLWFEGLGDHRFSSARKQPIPAGAAWVIGGRWLEGIPTLQILLHDPESGFLGWSAYSEGRLRFPVALENTARIVGACAWRPTGADLDLLVGIVREERKYELRVWRIIADKGLEVVQQTPLTNITRDVFAPIPIPGLGLMVCSAHENTFFLLPDGEGGLLKVVETAPGSSTNLLRRKKPEDFLVLPLDTPLPSCWVLIQESAALFLVADANGHVRIIDQINLNGSGRIAGFLPLAPGGESLGVLDSARNLMEVHERDARGVLNYQRDLALPPLQAQFTRLDYTLEGPVLRVTGRDQAALILPRAASQALRIESLYETDLPETTHQRIISGDFNGDGQMDIALLDPVRSNTLEFLHHDGSRWRSVMHFQIYDAAQAPEGRRGGEVEPREALVLDINRDGLDDLVLLVHDRILVYLQDPR